MSVTDTDLPFDIQRRGYSPEQVKDYLHRLHLRFERNVEQIDRQQQHIDKIESELGSAKKQLASVSDERDRVTRKFGEMSAAAAEHRRAADAARKGLADASSVPPPGVQISTRLQQILALAEEEANRITEEAGKALRLANTEAGTIRREAEQAATDARAAAEADVRKIYSDRNDIIAELLNTSERLRELLDRADIIDTEETVDSAEAPDSAEAVDSGKDTTPEDEDRPADD